MLVIRGYLSAFRQIAEDFGDRHADLPHLVGQTEQAAILPVPADQPEVLVEDGDALFHLVERRLQQVAVLLQRL